MLRKELVAIFDWPFLYLFLFIYLLGFLYLIPGIHAAVLAVALPFSSFADIDSPLSLLANLEPAAFFLIEHCHTDIAGQGG